MPFEATIKGDKELGDEMVALARGMNMDIKKVVPIAAYLATTTGARVCAPGERLREVIKRSKPPQSKDIHKRTDTSRTSTHWVKFYRQGKAPIFVPVNPNPMGAKPNREREPEQYKKWDRGRKKKDPPSTPSVYAYQQSRKGTQLNGKGKMFRYDTPQDLLSMRTIGRRGLAGEVWNSLGNRTGGGRKLGLKARDSEGKLSGRVTSKNKGSIERDSKKWGSLDKTESPTNMNIVLENKLTYVAKRYPGAEGQIIARTAEGLKNELKNRLIRRQKGLEKAAKL